MKKLLLLTLALIFLLSLSACGGKEQAAEPTSTANVPIPNEPVSGETISNDFRLKLHADKSVYRTDEAIQIHATIEYIGEKETQNMEGGGSVLVFSVTDGADFNMGGLWLTELRRYGFKRASNTLPIFKSPVVMMHMTLWRISGRSSTIRRNFSSRPAPIP